MAEKISAVLKMHANDPQICGLLLRAKGKNFCTGADLEWIASDSDKDFSSFQEMYQIFLNLPFPVISEVQGKVYGAGCGLISVSDIVISDHEAEFCMPELSWGLIPGIITPLVIRKIGLSRFTYKALTREFLSAKEALSSGWIHEVLSKDQVKIRIDQLISKISKFDQKALSTFKKSLILCSDLDPELLEKMKSLSSSMKDRPEVKQRIRSFLDKKI